MVNPNNSHNSLKEDLKKRIKEKLKQELLDEIYKELKLEEEELSEEISSILINKSHKKQKIKTMAPSTPTQKSDEKVKITVNAILKIASHALKYANEKIPRNQWVEVIGLLAGRIENGNDIVYIEDAYPMGHGTALNAEIKDYKNYVRAFKEIKKKGLFICGWYHSHPSYSCFMSEDDMGTQARYQKLWNRALALVIDPYEIDGTSLGFQIYRANLKTYKWFSVPYGVQGSLDVKMLPELLQFINPIIDGKAIYLEYDED